MSASLVGSEMCIRDRSRAMAARPRPSAAPLAIPASSASPELSAVVFWAVSYTHLTLPTICSV
eukprot:11918225-Alexandrium_andersonii.AAC.1